MRFFGVCWSGGTRGDFDYFDCWVMFGSVSGYTGAVVKIFGAYLAPICRDVVRRKHRGVLDLYSYFWDSWS